MLHGPHRSDRTIIQVDFAVYHIAQKEHKRQIFREQVNPFIGGRIPEGAYHSDRLLLNRLNAAGFSLPDGVLLAHKRPPVGQSASDDQSSILLRFIQTTDNRPTPPEGVTHRPEPVESTYLLRVPAGWKHGKIQGLPLGRPLPSVIGLPGPEQLAKLAQDHLTPSPPVGPSSLGPSPSSALQPPPPPQHYHPPPQNHPPLPPPLPPHHPRPPQHHPPPPPTHHSRPPQHHPPPPPPNHPIVHFHLHNQDPPHPQPSNIFPVTHDESAETLLNAHLPGSIFNDAHSVEDFDSSLLLNDDDLEHSGPWSSFFSDEQADFLLPNRLSVHSRPQNSAHHFGRHQNNHLPGLTHYGPPPF